MVIKIFNKILFCVIFLIISSYVNVVSATENSPLLKFQYKEIDKSHFEVILHADYIPAVSAFGISIGFNPENVRVCTYNEASGKFETVETGLIKRGNEENNSDVLILGESFTDRKIKGWDGSLLFNDFYPYIDNESGLLKTVFFRLSGEKILENQKIFSIRFERIGNGNPEIGIASGTDEVYDSANPLGAGFANSDGYIDIYVEYDGSGVFKENGMVVFIDSGSDKKSDKEDVEFSDISHVEWAEPAINGLKEKGIVSGRGNGVFAPEEFITRAEAVKMLVLAADIPVITDIFIFDDVSYGQWYFDYIGTAYETGVAKGVGNNLFMPGANVSRQDFCTMAGRLFFDAGDKNVSLTELTFSDKDMIQEYAIEDIKVLYEKNIISGRDGNVFDPCANVTRAEAAKIIFNCIEHLED